jgi:membrane-associated phospholipid phosphatase
MNAEKVVESPVSVETDASGALDNLSNPQQLNCNTARAGGWVGVWLLPVLGWAGVLALWWSGTNTSAFLALNRWAGVAPDALWACLTLLGHTCAAFALLAPALYRNPQWLSAAMLAVLPASFYSLSLKRLFDATRPAGQLDLASFQIIGEKLVSHSFPSGHTITAFAVAGAVWGAGLSLRGWQRAVLVLAAAAVGFSRIAVGAHWPMDVLMGAAGGWLSGMLGAWAVRQWPVLDGDRARAVWLWVWAVMGASLFVVESGYPQANILQWALACAVVGVAAHRAWIGRSGAA